MKTIVLTGGGTAGHVTPNIALIPYLEREGFKINYIGTINGMEKELISRLNIPYDGIPSGKLRRYLDIRNFTDTFRVMKGVREASKLIKKIKPDIVFSKGGFVSVPVVVAAKMNKVPVVIHESDISTGLANKIAIPFATAVCAAFPEALKNIPEKKAILTGTPIRRQLFNGKAEKGFEITNFNDILPIILFMGGSQGSIKINDALRSALPTLLKNYQIIHICGKNNIDEELLNITGYKQFEYISDELPHLFAISNMFVSRAGANSIYEFLALKKPNLLIPLSKSASRGDQILNAQSFENQGFSKVLSEEDLTADTLIENINDLYLNKDKYIGAMQESVLSDGVFEVMKVIRSLIEENRTEEES